MIKQYEVEEIITRALEELNGVFSKPDENGNRSLYEATVEDKGRYQCRNENGSGI